METQPIQWTTDPSQVCPKEQAEFFLNSGAKAQIDKAFADGLLVAFDMQTTGKNNQDLEIKIVLRHKSAVPDLT